ncbi:hypothetical protein CRG98_025923 [Punica granatum]|uniref:Uncharacterized protein n=1 Tax=Punica granatum TaxID=22663 RepID=A0A2I0JBQ6_PUNGR|nr:hypothetical protein CRG98_025923 [Punica granatum]
MSRDRSQPGRPKNIRNPTGPSLSPQLWGFLLPVPFASACKSMDATILHGNPIPTSPKVVAPTALVGYTRDPPIEVTFIAAIDPPLVYGRTRSTSSRYPRVRYQCRVFRRKLRQRAASCGSC